MDSCSVGASRISSGRVFLDEFSSLTTSRRMVESSLVRHTQEPTAVRFHATESLDQEHRYADTYDSDDSRDYNRGYRRPDPQPGPSRVYSGEENGDDDDDDAGADSDTSHPV